MIRGAVSPRLIMAVFGAFFIVWGIVSLVKQHRSYAVYSLSLGLIWLGLAWWWSDSEPRP